MLKIFFTAFMINLYFTSRRMFLFYINERREFLVSFVFLVCSVLYTCG